MTYVYPYLLQSIALPGESKHTRKYAPWRLVTYGAFSDPAKALAFERYLKSASGRAFVKKRLR